MSDRDDSDLDLLVIGAGPTGIGIGAEATKAGLSVLLVDRGPLTASLLRYPTFMGFFTTRDRMEVGGIPFAIPDDKPDRRQAIIYYQRVARHFGLDVKTETDVERVQVSDARLDVFGRSQGEPWSRRAGAVVVATGFFDYPRRLAVPGEDQDWVRARYLEPYAHFGRRVVVVGGGNSACEAALEMWRAGVDVTLVHRGERLKPSVKYWLKPDVENRIAEGSIEAFLSSTVTEFGRHEVVLQTPDGVVRRPCDAAYVLVGYEPNPELLQASGVHVDPDSLVPEFDPESYETNVPGLYVAGAVQSGADTNKIFIDNSRDHGATIVRHVASRLAARLGSRSGRPALQ